MRQWRDALARRGWIAPGWPREYGGAGLSTYEQFILNQELALADAPQVGGLGVKQLGPTLIVHGNAQQKKRHLTGILSGEVIWCQGYSEPGAGSDLASLKTRAARDGDDFVVNGQKMWTTGATQSDWCFALVRTDPDAPKHRGITYLLIDMKTPGITVRPVLDLANEHHVNEVFFEDVRVPAENMVGDENRGWYVGTTTLDEERSAIATFINLQREVMRYVRWVREHKAEFPPDKREIVRNLWADRWIEASVGTVLAERVVSMQAAGRAPNVEASIAKLHVSELKQRLSYTGIRTFGLWGQVTTDDAPMRGIAAMGVMREIPVTIAGGSTEVMKNIIAQRGCGLPR
jgi:alkylation response protein AidB-like acyl-CoA dehydrogenase